MNEKQRARAEAVSEACRYVSGSTEEKREPVIASDLPSIVSLAEYIIGRDEENSPHGPDEWRLRAVRAEAALSHARAERDAAQDALGAEKRPTPDSPSGYDDESGDEALARVLFDVSEDRGNGTFSWSTALVMARAAREHIEDEKSKTGAALYYGAAATRRAEKAEAERDELRDACNSWQSAAQEAEYQSKKFRDERDEWKTKFERAYDLYSRVRNERDEAEDDRNDWEDRSARNLAALWTAEAESNEWKAKYEQADTLLSWTRDERDSLRHVLKSERDTSAAREEWLRGRHASLRNDVAACRNACQIEDILYRDELWGEQP